MISSSQVCYDLIESARYIHTKDLDAKAIGAQTYSSKNTLVVDKNTGDLVLPASLKITATDSEQVRKMKKKGIKALKNEYRKLQQDEQRHKRKVFFLFLVLDDSNNLVFMARFSK